MMFRLLLLGLFLGPGACTCMKSDEELMQEVMREQERQDQALPEENRPIELTVVGLNYTDLSIYSFSVGGIGGATIAVSSPITGGGGGVCCLRWYPGAQLPIPVKVKWTRDNKRFCEKEALITGPEPLRPRHLGVHFFPDGHIELKLTEEYPAPLLRLERFSETQRKQSDNVVLDEQVARCKDGYL